MKSVGNGGAMRTHWLSNQLGVPEQPEQMLCPFEPRVSGYIPLTPPKHFNSGAAKEPTLVSVQATKVLATYYVSRLPV